MNVTKSTAFKVGNQEFNMKTDQPAEDQEKHGKTCLTIRKHTQSVKTKTTKNGLEKKWFTFVALLNLEKSVCHYAIIMLI